MLRNRLCPITESEGLSEQNCVWKGQLSNVWSSVVCSYPSWSDLYIVAKKNIPHYRPARNLSFNFIYSAMLETLDERFSFISLRVSSSGTNGCVLVLHNPFIPTCLLVKFTWGVQATVLSIIYLWTTAWSVCTSGWDNSLLSLIVEIHTMQCSTLGKRILKKVKKPTSIKSAVR